MIGINIYNLDTIIKKNNLYLSSYNDNSKMLISIINELNTCYDGNSIVYLFDRVTKEIKNIQTISNIIESYSNGLSSVKISYQKQDQNFSNKINHMTSNLK